MTVFGQQLQAMAGSLAQEEARAVSLLNDYQELPQEVTSTLTPPCQDLSTERPSAKEILRELPVRMPQFKQDVLNYGRGVFEEEFLALRQVLATYEQPGLNQEDLAIKEIVLEVATEMIAFDQQLQALVPSPLPEQGGGLQNSSVRPTEFDRLFQEMAAFQEQAVGFNNRREMPRVTVTPTLPTPSQELGNPVNT